MSPRSKQSRIPAKNCNRMVVLGSSKVGKTSIVTRFLNGHFNEQYIPSIDEFHRKLYRIRGEIYQLDVLDTSGNVPYPAMRRLAILTGDIFLLVFSIDSHESFKEVVRLREQIIQTKSALHNRPLGLNDVPIVICGNRAEVADATSEVESYLGPDVAYFEVSAKCNLGLDDMFSGLFQLAGLPSEMSPALHRCISPLTHSAKEASNVLPDAGSREPCGLVSPTARRPSINSDLMYVRQKVQNGRGQGKERDRCCVQ
uniref:dexamethasone-induced Ras-related protein 1 n=1 Tax=Myxine glutinosa TaxID=7769 RepID=UPI00358E35DD